jgi:hypothetical protein
MQIELEVCDCHSRDNLYVVLARVGPCRRNVFMVCNYYFNYYEIT